MIRSKETEWNIVEGVTDGHGDVKNLYKWKGHDAIRHALSSRRAKHLAGYRLIERDVRNAKSWIETIIRLINQLGPDADPSKKNRQRTGDVETNDIIKGLFVATIAIYGKMYTGAKGRLVSLNESIIKDPKHKDWHDALIELRHSFVAHSGEEKHERCEIVWALCLHEGLIQHKVFSELNQPNHFSIKDYKEMVELLDFLHTHVKKKCEDLWTELQEKELTESEVQIILQLYGKSGMLKPYLH